MKLYSLNIGAFINNITLNYFKNMLEVYGKNGMDTIGMKDYKENYLNN